MVWTWHAVNFSGMDQAVGLQILAAETFPYDRELLHKLEQACNWNRKEIDELDRELGFHYAELLNDFHRKDEAESRPYSLTWAHHSSRSR